MTEQGLLGVQRDVAAALAGDDAESAARAARRLAGDAARAERRLAIYRANIAAASAKALAAAYPVLRQVVGGRLFDTLAGDYRRRFGSASGDLNDHGESLPAFVAEWPPADSLPYLAGLARLEWAVHRAYGAADAEGWDRQAIARVAPARQSGIRLRWVPGTAVVESDFPLVRIWHIHQPDFEGEFGVDWSRHENAFVARDGLRVVVSALDPAEAAFVAASLAGDDLGASAQRALGLDPGFDLGALLARLLTQNAVDGFTLQSGNGKGPSS